METPIQHVSDTAFWVAVFRAVESERPDALFHDPLAKVLAGEHGQEIAKTMGNAKIMAWSMAIRTYLIDDLIMSSLPKGIKTVVNLGTGLDSRPYRLKVPSSLNWIEADFPQIIDYKESLLKNEKPLCHLERFKVDLSKDSVRKAFLEEINSRGGDVLVLTEGVTPYLPNAEVAALAKNLADQPNFKIWVTDYFSPEFMKLYRQGRFHKGLYKNAPFLFTPENWQKFFNDGGWDLKKMLYTSEEGLKLNRPPPLPFLFKLISPFMPAARKQAVNRMTGYALLEKRS